MDWGELLRGVGDWSSGIADSTLIAGVIGAGAALLGNRVGQRRREKREDVAAWRDRRLDLFSSVLDTINEAQSVGIELILRLKHEATTVEAFPGPSLGAQIEALGEYLAVMNEQRRQMRLMADEATWALFEGIYSKMADFYAVLPSDLSITPVLSNEEVGLFREIQTVTSRDGDRLQSLMKRQLGLPEDE